MFDVIKLKLKLKLTQPHTASYKLTNEKMKGQKVNQNS